MFMEKYFPNKKFPKWEKNVGWLCLTGMASSVLLKAAPSAKRGSCLFRKSVESGFLVAWPRLEPFCFTASGFTK